MSKIKELKIGSYRLIPANTVIFSICNQANISLVEDTIVKLTASTTLNPYHYFCKPMDSINNYIGRGRDEYSIDISKTLPYNPKKKRNIYTINQLYTNLT